MKNLKRVLSLGLASVMLLGMMVVGAGAAGFTDADEIEHQEAVDVLYALNVVNGKEDGSYFDPQSTVTRGEMAKMIAIAMQGGSEVNTGVKTSPSFTDIKDHWAEPYIEYCADLGIISGRGDGTFDPEGNVTTIEVTKMVLTALGYDADAYKLTGASWASRTDEEARKTRPRSLYEDLSGSVVMNQSATRDTAAQLIWNGLQTYVVTVSPESDQNSDGLTWNYNTSGTTKLLEQRYNGKIWIGTYEGNYDTNTSNNAGEITVKGHIEDKDYTREISASFPSDLPISNIGEEIKVIFKDGTNGTKDQPDNKDSIYGAFNTGSTTVYTCLRDDIDQVDNGNSKRDKIEIDDVNRDVAKTENVYVYVDYDIDSTGGWHGKNTYVYGDTAGYDLATALKSEGMALGKGDELKFVCNEDGQINAVYVNRLFISKVNSISSDKISIDGVGSIEIAENDVPSGLAEDDVIYYSKWYEKDKDDAFFTVYAAEIVDGEITGYRANKYSSNDKVTLDGKTYNVHGYLGLEDVTDDANTEIKDDDIGEDATIYLINGFVAAVDMPDTTTTSYALVTGYNSGAQVDSAYDALNVKLLMSDGTEAKYDVHKDSTYSEKSNSGVDMKGSYLDDRTFASSSNSVGGAGEAFFGEHANVLVKYSMSGGNAKIKDIAGIQTGDYSTGTDWNSNTSVTGKLVPRDFTSVNNAVDVSNGVVVDLTGGGAGSNMTITLWDKDAKSLQIGTSNSNRVVASTDAVLYVYVPSVDKYYTYNLRSLNDIKVELNGGDKLPIQYYTKNGQIVAAYVELGKRPGTSAGGSSWGMITNRDGTRKVGDTTYSLYRVWTGEEKTEIYVEGENGQGVWGGVRTNLAVGQLITFDTASDNLYDPADVTIIAAKVAGDPGYGVKNNGTATNYVAIAVDNYNSSKNLLTYWTGTQMGVSGSAYEGRIDNGAGRLTSGDKLSVTVDSDCVIVYVDIDDESGSTSGSVSKFDTATGFSNAVISIDDDGLVEAIIVETGGVAGKTPYNNRSGYNTNLFGEVGVAANASEINSILAKQQNCLVEDDITLSADVDIANGKSITFEGDVTTSSGKTLTVAGTANIEGDVSGATIVLNGGTVNLNGTVTSALNNISGNGNLVLGENVVVPYGTWGMNDIAASGLNAATPVATITTTPVDVTLTSGIVLSGDGALEGFSVGDTMNTLAAKTGSDTFKFVTFKVPASNGNNAKIYYSSDNGSNYAQPSGVVTGLGSSSGYTVQTSDLVDGKLPVTFYVGDKVTNVKISVGSDNYVFNINQ